MAEAQMNDEMQQQFQLALQMGALQQSADQDSQVAQAKTAQATVEVGTKPANVDYVVQPGQSFTTFGNTQAVKKANGTTEITIPQQGPQNSMPGGNINPQAIVQQQISGIKPFDVDTELKKLRTIQNPDERQDGAQQLLFNIESQMTLAQQNIRAIAAQRSGVNNAQSSLDQNLALDIAATKIGKIKPGDTTIQTQQANQMLAAAMSIADKMEKDLIAVDPNIRRLDMYRKIVISDYTKTEQRAAAATTKTQQRELMLEDRTPYFDDTALHNVAGALNMKTTDRDEILDAARVNYLKDPNLKKVINADKETLPALLLDKEQKVRQYAFNIIANSERQVLGLKDSDPLPQYIQQLQKLIIDRNSLMTPADKKMENDPKYIAANGSGAAQKEESKHSLLLNSLNKLIEDTSALKYHNMSQWSFTDPRLKSIVDDLKTKSTGGPVLMNDAITGIVNADIKNQDGSNMNQDQKMSAILSSLNVTMQNDKGSMILPNADTFYPKMAATAKTFAMRAFIRKNTAGGPDTYKTDPNTGLPYINQFNPAILNFIGRGNGR